MTVIQRYIDRYLFRFIFIQVAVFILLSLFFSYQESSFYSPVWHLTFSDGKVLLSSFAVIEYTFESI